MKISIKTLISLIFSISTFYLYVSNVRPVGWFDSLIGMFLAAIVFFVVKRFKGFKL
jgi:uncharacterized BrkB/YihY/UPF0761 family membrane protein